MKCERDDPLGTLLLIDSLALKSMDYNFLLCFYDEYKAKKNLDFLPNWLYSLSLAHYFLSQATKDEIDASSQREKALKYVCFYLPMKIKNLICSLFVVFSWRWLLLDFHPFWAGF